MTTRDAGTADGRNAQHMLGADRLVPVMAVFGKSLDGIITSWNAGAHDIYGYTADEAIGQSVRLLFPPGRGHELESIMNRLRRGEEVENLQTQRRRKDGSLMDMSVTVTPFCDRDRNVLGAVVRAYEISGYERAAADLAMLHQRLLRMRPRAGPAAPQADRGPG